MIRYLAGRFRARGAVRVGIGDDAAVFAGEGRYDWVVTTDLMIEGIHFHHRYAPARALGWKALARSLSDIAAMGAEPCAALVALAVPRSTPTAWVKEFFAGLDQLARRYRVQLAGGDLSVAPQVVADVQALGQVAKGRAVLRSGARPGDVVFVSGTLGLATTWLEIMRRRVISLEEVAIRASRAHHLPQPRVELGRALVRRRVATAMIDVSDGLSTDLHHICEASGVGARVFAEQIPAVELPAPLARRLSTTGLELALNGGEDYELLFTLPRARAARLPKKLAGVKLTQIGEITRDRRMWLVDERGRARLLAPRGWDPFRRTRWSLIVEAGRVPSW
jgi:thiamine-monophosphate kinase